MNSYCTSLGGKKWYKNSHPEMELKKSFVSWIVWHKRNLSWACFVPLLPRKAATARTNLWLFSKLQFARIRVWSSRGDWDPRLARKIIFIKKASLIGSDSLWMSVIIKNQVSTIILCVQRAATNLWHSRHVLEQICWDFRPEPEVGVRTHYKGLRNKGGVWNPVANHDIRW